MPASQVQLDVWLALLGESSFNFWIEQQQARYSDIHSQPKTDTHFYFPGNGAKNLACGPEAGLEKRSFVADSSGPMLREPCQI
ncbi:hypothetical protein PIB30_106546 [Stylosanthes scabra]|uniref:Uncharacterized protein n=1 Tax=Stylosanthes scabra TaxID=79078 RepID=A0ABU6VXF5_9FABA|nr:hypothetical protein [Stylosanthes scabra]